MSNFYSGQIIEISKERRITLIECLSDMGSWFVEIDSGKNGCWTNTILEKDLKIYTEKKHAKK